MKRGLLALLLLSACNGSTATPAEPAPTVSTSVVVKPQISWPAASTIDERALQSLGDGRSQLSRSPVPVLAPSSSLAPLERPTVIVEGEYYVITARNHGATISIQGTRKAHRYEGVDPHPGNKRLRSGTGFVTVNEGIRSASFIENGVAYSVDVECATNADARCADDAFVTEITNQLVYVGGGAAR